MEAQFYRLPGTTTALHLHPAAVDKVFLKKKNNSLSVSCFPFSDTDSGLRFGQRNRFLLRQWLCRLLHCRDLDGAADLTPHAVDFRVRSAHDHAFKHHGSIRRPQRSIDFCTSVRVKHSKAHTLLSPSVPPRRSWTPESPSSSCSFCTCLFLWRYFSSRLTFPLIFSPVVFFP